MESDMTFVPVTRDNWEDVLKIELEPSQRDFAPSAAESLAAAYIMPWDEALDPYAICIGDHIVGLFYLSYTPESKDNYWIGGFVIDKRQQNKGLGREALTRMLRFIPHQHPQCREINLTVEEENTVARSLYESVGFAATGGVNSYGEVILSICVE